MSCSRRKVGRGNIMLVGKCRKGERWVRVRMDGGTKVDMDSLVR